MRSEEARVGGKVRIVEGYRDPKMRGRSGRIAQKYGHPDRSALEVIFEDGESKLFWFHELDEVKEEQPAGYRPIFRLL